MRQSAGPAVTTQPMKRVELGEVPYERTLEDMRQWVEERRAGTEADRLFFLSHPPVITYGRRTAPGGLPGTMSDIPVIGVDRGGMATYHGPGQLIGYLVMNIRERGPVDVVRWLETKLVEALGKLGFETLRRDTPLGGTSLAGVWTPDHRRLVSIGMRIRGGITSHGFALNVDPDLSVFRRFMALGLPDVWMTSLQEICAEEERRMPSGDELRDTIAAVLGAQ